MQKKSKINTILLIILIILAIYIISLLTKKNNSDPMLMIDEVTQEEKIETTETEKVLKTSPVTETVVMTPLEGIYASFDTPGSIAECRYQGKFVYTVADNATDSGLMVYDISGSFLGDSGYQPKPGPDYINEEDITACSYVFIVKNNPWGYTPIDIYRLGA